MNNQQPFQQKEGQGSLFPNNRKTQENHPDYTGQILINGVECWLSGWLKTSQSGVQYVSVAVKPKDSAPQYQQPQAPQYQQPQAPQYQQFPAQQAPRPQSPYQAYNAEPQGVPTQRPTSVPVPPQTQVAAEGFYPQGMFAPNGSPTAPQAPQDGLPF